MMTLTGNYVETDIGAMTLADIALGLSRIPRFGGQTLFEWHVADHVVCATNYLERLVDLGFESDGATKLLPLHVLLHDAHEAMTGDIPTHFKTPDMKALQAKLDERIYLSLGFEMPNAVEVEIIKFVDRAMLLAEAKVVTPHTTYEKICWETADAAMPTAVEVVEQHLHNDVNSREAFLAIANTFTEASHYVR